VAHSPELVDFVKDALSRGVSRQQIEQVLRSSGWPPEQVHSALAAFAPVDFPIPVPRPRPSLSAREAFMYLLLFTTLYLVAYNLGSLLFDIVNRMFPDPAAFRPDQYARDSMRWSISSLIVALPVFLYMAHLAGQQVERDRTKRSSPIRRWLTYLTLFNAACVLIGDVVTLVYNVLGGEVTARFASKVIVVAAIAGTIFWYYLSELRSDEDAAAV